MAKLTASERANLPDSAFAYVDSTGKRRLPINDESHVRNALSRFDQVHFESDAARERSRTPMVKVICLSSMTSVPISKRARAFGL